jgi:hypothetical protein
MTNFALIIWAWEKTGTATALALTGLAFFLPNIIVYPIAGVFFGRLIGIGPGRGISLLFLVIGVVSTIVGIGGYLLEDVRDVESILSDYDATGISSETTVGV